LQKHGVQRIGRKNLENRYRGSRMKLKSRGLAKAGWIGVIRKLGHMFGTPRDAGTKTAEHRQNEVLQQVTPRGGSVTVVNGAAPMPYLDKRDGAVTKALNMTRKFITSKLIPDARRGVLNAAR
jgi:chaperonin GroEL (HSP60 family)